MIHEGSEEVYEFGPFRLDVSERILLSNNQPTAIKAKVFDLLTLFVVNSGHILNKEELMRHLWPDTQVEEHNLTVSVSELRKILAVGDNSGRYIQTVPRKGYRFLADMHRLKNKSAESVGAEKADASADTHSEPPGSLPPVEQAEVIYESNPETKHQPVSGTKTTADTPALSDFRASHSNWKRAIVVLLGVNVLIVAGFSIWLTMIRLRNNKHGAGLFKDAAVNKITNNGKIRHAAISPDGRYIAYIAESSGTQSVYIKQITTDSTVQLTSTSEPDEGKLAFSPGGDYIYYTKATPDNTYELYRVPALGGASQKIIENVNSPITFSPDGKQFAFVRRPPGATELVIADGSHERTLAVRKSPDFFSNAGPSWSPDGKLIACIVGSISRACVSMSSA
jgi:DNA-binding winged helix-turn-helix (wHTH) protein